MVGVAVNKDLAQVQEMMRDTASALLCSYERTYPTFYAFIIANLEDRVSPVR